MRQLELTRTTPFRLTLLSGAIFSIAVFLLLGLIYFQTAAYMTRQMNDIVASQAEALEAAGPTQIADRVSEVVSADYRRVEYYGLFDGDGRWIAGNVKTLPPPALWTGQAWDFNQPQLQPGARALVKTQVVPSGHDPKRYEARRLFATASDGAEVPITLLMPAGASLDGTAPLLLYGYGSYGISIDPGFSISRLSLVDRGVIFAIAHIRGGSEKGWGWFLDGRGEKKTNTFTDFVACAETLIAGGYSSAGKIVAMGGSAGGMLMGAVANLRPDLFAGIIGQVPFVDVLNTMSDASLPLTPPEWPEWGNPLESESDYDRIAAYSPYDNITARPYPAVLATGGLSDPRVTYWEPAKWAAKLREYTTSDRPVLLKINMDAGHAGAAGRFDGLKEVALDYAFALWAFGLA